jgi:dolichyl-phosphate-mannose-protein mannosyltransferase
VIGRGEPSRVVGGSRRPFLTAAGVLAVLLVFTLAAYIAIHGRFDLTIGRRHIAIRRVTPVSLAGWLLAMGVAASMSRPVRDRTLERLDAVLRTYDVALAALLSIGVCAVGIAFGAFTAAGADPYGYVSQSLLWASGNPVQPLPAIALEAPVSAAAFCPIGYSPGIAAGTMVPKYAPGFPLQMASLVRLGGPSACYLGVPLLAGLVAWFAYRIARHFNSPGPALLAAVCVVSSPVFVFETMHQMSDVPATAWWLVAMAFALGGSTASAAGAGLAVSVAVLTRPNIVPLVLPVAALVIMSTEAPRSRFVRLLVFFAACTPGITLVAATNHVLYGSALASGYGALGDVYRGEPLANARQYTKWLWETHSIYVFIPALLPVVALIGKPRLRRDVTRVCWWTLAFAGVLLACYLFYVQFDHWTYLRFLLPAIAVLIIAATTLLSDVLNAASRGTRAAVFFLVAAMIPFAYVHTASKGDAFALKAAFRHEFEDAAAFAATRLPASAVYLALNESGSLRHYAHRLTVRYDLVEPAQADALVAYLRAHGLTVYLALQRSELPAFRRRFADTSIGWAASASKGIALPPDGKVLFFPIYPAASPEQ